MKFDEENLLKVELINGKIVISIGVDALAFAVENSPDWYDEYKPDPKNNYEEFGKSILQYLEHEEGDGTTPIHRMFDSVALEALDQGCEGFLEVEDEE